MITKKVACQAKEKYIFLDQKRKQLADLRKKIIKLGLDPNALGVFTQPIYKERWLQKQLDNQNIS